MHIGLWFLHNNKRNWNEWTLWRSFRNGSSCFWERSIIYRSIDFTRITLLTSCRFLNHYNNINFWDLTWLCEYNIILRRTHIAPIKHKLSLESLLEFKLHRCILWDSEHYVWHEYDARFSRLWHQLNSSFSDSIRLPYFVHNGLNPRVEQLNSR